MVRLVRRGAVALTVVTVVLAACGGEEEPAASVPEPALRLVLSSPGGPAGGPIPVTATLENGTAATVTVARPFFAGNIVAFSVVDAAGEEVPFDGPYAQLEPLHEDRIVTLDPGESASHQFDLAEHFMLELGTYTVSAAYRFQPVTEGGPALAVVPGDGPVASPITVEVGP